MGWSRWYACRSYLRSALWIVPLVALMFEQAALHAVFAIDARTDWAPAWPLETAGTKSAIETIINLVLSFIVFTFGSMLVAIQVAGGQLTPRIIARLVIIHDIAASNGEEM